MLPTYAKNFTTSRAQPSALRSGRGKPQRKKVGILQHKSQAHRPALQGGHIGALFPSDAPIERVAIDDLALLQAVAGQRPAGLVLDFHSDAPRRGGGKIQPQLAAREAERPGQQLAAPARRVNGDKAV